MAFLKLLLVLIALGYLVSQIRQFRLAQASQRWHSVRGKVRRAFVEEHPSFSNRGGERIYHYSANVVYTYQIGAQQFESTHLTFEPTTGLTEDAVTQLLDGITEGTEVDVFYDPLNHEQAVLIPGTSSGNTFQLVLAIAGFAFSIGFALFADTSGGR